MVQFKPQKNQYFMKATELLMYLVNYWDTPVKESFIAEAEIEKELIEQTMSDASRALAAEIPRVPRLEDWVKFKEETG